MKLHPTWATVRLGDCSDLVRGITFPASAKLAGGTADSVVCLRTSNVQDTLETEDVLHIPRDYVSQNAQFVSRNDIVISMSNSKALVGKAALATTDLERTVIGGFLAILRVRVVEPRFVIHLLRSNTVRRRLTELSSITTNIANLSATAIRDLDVPLPPLPEQLRIVEAIECYFTRLDDALTTLERVRRNLKRYRASVLRAAVEGRLVPSEAELARTERRDYEPASVLLERILAERRHCWETSGRKRKYEEPIAPDTTDLPGLPEGWCWTTLDMLSARTSVGHVGPTSEFYCGQEHGVVFVRSQNVRPGRLDLDGVQYITREFHQTLKKSQLTPGDLLVVRVGANRGDACIVPEGAGDLNCANIVFSRVLPEVGQFIGLYCQSTPGRGLLLGMTTGSAQGVLNTMSVASLMVPLPPSAEQARIMAEADRLLSVADGADAILAPAGRRCTRARQSILKWAFEGKLADQDPSDEPASLLLERIRAERVAATPAKSARLSNGRARRTA